MTILPGQIWERYDYSELRWRDFVITDIVPRGYKHKLHTKHDRRSPLVVAIYIEDVSNTRQYFKLSEFKTFRKVETDKENGP